MKKKAAAPASKAAPAGVKTDAKKSGGKRK
jgi:hypothetical protein